MLPPLLSSAVVPQANDLRRLHALVCHLTRAGPRIRAALTKRGARNRPWRLRDLLFGLRSDPIPPEKLWKAFGAVPLLPPLEERVVAMIVGVSEQADG